MHSLLVVRNLQQAYSKRQYSAVSPTLLWKTSSQQHKMHLEWYRHISREGISGNRLPGIFGGCRIPLQLQLDKSQWAPCTGCSQQAPLGQASHVWPPGHSQSPRGLWTQRGFAHLTALRGTPTHCWGLFHMPSLPAFPPSQTLGFITVPILLLPTFWCLGVIPQVLPRATQSHWVQNTSHGMIRPKGCHKNPVLSILQVISDETATLLFKLAEESRRSQYHLFPLPVLLEHTQFIYWRERQVHLISCPPSASSLFLKFISLAVNLWNWVAHYLLSSLFLFLSH